MAKVIFSHLSVILFMGGFCLNACWDTSPPGADTPRTRQAPREQTPPPDQAASPPRADTPPDQADPPGSRLQHTVYERQVRILLECILVYQMRKHVVKRVFVIVFRSQFCCFHFTNSWMHINSFTRVYM